MNSPELSFAVVSNVWCKQMHFKNAGDTMAGHSHAHDHMTLLAAGSVEVTVNGKAQQFTAPQIIFIAKGSEHHLVATSDNTVAYCIHGLRDAEGDIIDDSMIPDETKKEAVARIMK